MADSPPNPHRSPAADQDSAAPGMRLLDPAWFIIPAIVATTATAITASQALGGNGGYTRVTIWWLASLALLILAAVPADACRSIPALRPAHLSVRAWAPWLGMLAIAAIPRLALLDRFPTIIDGDGAAFIVRAVEFREGERSDWFGISFYGNPNAWAAAQGLVTELAGTGLSGHRTLSALAGAIGVIATWRLGRHLIGEPAAAIGAVMLASWPLHLQLSRVSLNNITDPTALALALLFIVRTVTYRRPLDAVACGLSLALGLYGYYGGRAFPVVIFLLLPILAHRHRLDGRAATRLLGWIVAACVVAIAPLLATYERNPDEFGGHMEMVSPFTVDRLRDAPADTISRYAANLWDAIVSPFGDIQVGYFRHDPPFFGWPLCILIVSGGLALLVDRYRSGEVATFACLAVPWALLTAGIATTIPISGQRYLAITPIFALAAGFGLWWLATLVARLDPVRLRLWPNALTLLTVALITIGNLTWLASEDRQIETYADHRTIAAWDLGWRLSRTPANPPPTVYFAGAPFIWTHSFPSLPFLTGNLPMIDLDTPLETAEDVPPLPAGTMLVLVPERAVERCTIEAALPGVLVTEVLTRQGIPLYLVFAREPLPGFTTGSTPAETMTSPADPAACQPA